MELHLSSIHQGQRYIFLKHKNSYLVTRPSINQTRVQYKVVTVTIKPQTRISLRFQWLLKILQQLYSLGFRLISHEVNMTVCKVFPHIVSIVQ